jgi:hypothetical protein
VKEREGKQSVQGELQESSHEPPDAQGETLNHINPNSA